VDRIDLKMLQLLQQRTKLSGQIGRMKRRHGAVIYVPERERELLTRLVGLSKGTPPARAVVALYREIMSSSRAAQGQAPIGLLRASAAEVLPASRACFGACDVFSPHKTWAELAKGLGTGALSLALLTADDLLAALRVPRWREEFLGRLTVTGDFVFAPPAKASPARRIFIVTPRGDDPAPPANRIVILIECKSTLNAIKTLFHSMSDFPIQAEELSRHAAAPRRGLGQKRQVLTLALLTSARPMDSARVLVATQAVGLSTSILGIYPATEDYGG
jgi:chorismate mutase